MFVGNIIQVDVWDSAFRRKVCKNQTELQSYWLAIDVIISC